MGKLRALNLAAPRLPIHSSQDCKNGPFAFALETEEERELPDFLFTMRSLFIGLLVLGLVRVASAEGDALSHLFHHTTHVITNTDVLPSEKPIPAPTPDHPVYYAAVSVGYKDIGPSSAGTTPPPNAGVIKALTKILETQGYKLATNKNAAQLVIVYSWGRLSPDKWDLGGTSSVNPIVMNRDQVLSYLGAYKVGLGSAPAAPTDQSFFGPGASAVNTDAALLDQISGQSFYAVSLAAYDVDSAKTNQPQLLWRTRISCPSVGHSMPEVLPTMLTLAAPFIGRETSKPVWINADDHFKPKVEIGEMKVLE